MTSITKIRGVIVAVACLITAACVRPGGTASGDLAPKTTITFHNQGRERVHVYLVSEKDQWLIGRVEPLETAHLALPTFGFASRPQAVALAVVPGMTPALQPRRDPRATLSMDELSDNLPGEEWIFVNGQIDGPIRARER